MTKRLPRTPSRLIRLAIADFRRVLRLKKTYVVNMGKWHKPNLDDGLCRACVAGAVIAGTLGESPDTEMYPNDYDNDTKSALSALDDFRRGFIWDGLIAMNKGNVSDTKSDAIDVLDNTLSWEINTAMQAKDWRTFNRHMLKLADELEKIRL